MSWANRSAPGFKLIGGESHRRADPMAVAAAEAGIEPRQVSFKGAKPVVTAFAPKVEAAGPEDRAALVDVLLTAVADHRVGNRPGRWEPRARKRRPKPGAGLTQPRATAKLAEVSGLSRTLILSSPDGCLTPVWVP